jgi:hypothetical protein
MKGESTLVDGTALYGGQTALRLTRRAMLLSAAAVPLAGCWGSTYEWNQKLTLIVQTPQGEVTASSVIRASYTYGQMPMSGNDMSGGYTGEAVVMKFANEKYLFALLNADRTDEYHRLLLTFAADLPDDREAGFAAITKLRGVKEVPRGLYPMLVTFGNLDDPKSVEQVQPNELASYFGAGYSLKSIMLEVTDEPETAGKVEAVIPWVVEHKGRILSPDLRLGPGSHNASEVLPIEKLNRVNFLRVQK